MIRRTLAATGCAVLLSASAFATSEPADTMPPAPAREVVGKTIELVESKGL